MAVSFGTYYIDSVDFESATNIFTDAGMTTTAPDGVYQYNGVHRTMTNGILGAVDTCPSCCAPCGLTVYPVPTAKNRMYEVCAKVGPSTGTSIIIKFKFTGNPAGRPLGFSAVYDGITYSGVISNRFGLMDARYVGDTNAIPVIDITDNSPYDLERFRWVPLVSDFQTTSGVYTAHIATANVSGAAGNPDECYMVIPKNSAAQTIEVRVESPHTMGTVSGGADVTVYCPSAMNAFTTSAAEGSAVDACSSLTGVLGYNVTINGTTTAPRIFDPVFTDPAGATPMPDGYYSIPNTEEQPSPNGWMRVEDGVVSATGTCASGGYPARTESVCSPIAANSSILTACGYTLPDTVFWHDGSGNQPTAGDTMYEDVLSTTPLPDGFYQTLAYNNVIEITGGSGVINSIIFCS